MFKMNYFWERIFYLLTYLSQGPSFLNPRAYSILHQRHHQHSDTSKDPHSPENYKNFAQMMIATLKEYQLALSQKNPSDVKRIWPKDWDSLDQFAISKLNIILWSIIYLSLYLTLADHWWLYLFLPLHFVMGPIQGAIVNWCGHKFGYRNFSLMDKSTNTLLWDVFLLGELFQNNHHRFAQNRNFAYKWYEWDPGFSILSLLLKLKIIKLAK